MSTDSEANRNSSVSSRLLLSTVQAFLDRISPAIRLVKVREDDKLIQLTVVCWPGLDDDLREEIDIAATEIVADTFDSHIKLEIIETNGPIASENVFEHGWVFRAREQLTTPDT